MLLFRGFLLFICLFFFSSSSIYAQRAVKQELNGRSSVRMVNLDAVARAIGYPDLAKAYKVSGEVIVRFYYNGEGSYKSHRIVKRAHGALTQAVLKRVKMIRVSGREEAVVDIHFSFSPERSFPRVLLTDVSSEESGKSEGFASKGELVSDGEEVTMASKEPEVTNMAQVRRLIGYPSEAKQEGIQGTVLVRVLVDEDGRYVKHKVVKEGDPLLAEAVEQHVEKLRFKPALQGEEPVKFWVDIPFRFKMDRNGGKGQRL